MNLNPICSTLIIESDVYVTEYVSTKVASQLIFFSARTFADAWDILADNIIDRVVMELFTQEDTPAQALEFLLLLQHKFPGIQVDVFTASRNRYLLQMLRSLGTVNIISKLEPLVDVDRFMDHCCNSSPVISDFIQFTLQRMPKPESLNALEWQVLIAMANKKTPDEIAQLIEKSIHTVFYYTRKIHDKLRVNTKSDYHRITQSLMDNPISSANISYRQTCH